MNSLIASKAFQLCLQKLAYKYASPIMDLADLIQIGNEAALKAVALYNPAITGKSGRVASPTTFFLSRARSAIRHALRDARTKLDRISDPPTNTDDRGVQLEQIPAEESNMFSVIDVHTVFKRLSQEEVELLSKVYLEGYTQEELAAQDCHCRQAVHFHLSKIMKKITKKHAA